MAGIGGDFTGFTFNGYYSADLGITRVSEGSRYNFDLLPTRNSKTAQNVGGHGTYYWDSFYTQKNMTINFAFDSLTETQKRNLSKVFGTDQISSLWFDEEPYKQYYVLVNTPLQLKAICFDTIEGQRIYKGEGSIQFVAYYPFALSRFKYLSESSYTNESEWQAASGMLSTKGSYDGTGTTIRLFNPGDFESDCCAYYAVSSSALSNTIQVKQGNTLYGGMSLASFAKKGDDTYIRINSRANVIEGLTGSSVSSLSLSGNIYNEYITSGDFFKIPIWTNTTTSLNLYSTISCAKLDYMYTYY